LRARWRGRGLFSRRRKTSRVCNFY